MEDKRILRLNELLKKEIGQILTEELDRAPGEFVTVTYVDTSSDLQHAKVYITIFPANSEKVLEARLNSTIYFIQQVLNDRMRMRPVPKIEWVLVKDPDKTQRLDELFDKIDKEK